MWRLMVCCIMLLCDATSQCVLSVAVWGFASKLCFRDTVVLVSIGIWDDMDEAGKCPNHFNM